MKTPDQVAVRGLSGYDGQAGFAPFEEGLETIHTQTAFGLFRAVAGDTILLEHWLDKAGESR